MGPSRARSTMLVLIEHLCFVYIFSNVVMWCRQIKVETLASHTAALGCWLVRVSRVRCRIRSCLLCRVC